MSPPREPYARHRQAEKHAGRIPRLSEQPVEPTDGTWVRACASAELAPGEAIAVEVDPPIALFNVDGEFYAIDDLCSHAFASLAEGYIYGDTVECAFHFAKFDIKTGKALTTPGFASVASYAVRVTDGAVFVNTARRRP